MTSSGVNTFSPRLMIHTQSSSPSTPQAASSPRLREYEGAGDAVVRASTGRARREDMRIEMATTAYTRIG